MGLKERVERALAAARDGIQPFADGKAGYVVEPWGRDVVSVRWQLGYTPVRSSAMPAPALRICHDILTAAGFDVQARETAEDQVHRLIVRNRRAWTSVYSPLRVATHVATGADGSDGRRTMADRETGLPDRDGPLRTVADGLTWDSGSLSLGSNPSPAAYRPD
jgi:hypothetical protein